MFKWYILKAIALLLLINNVGRSPMLNIKNIVRSFLAIPAIALGLLATPYCVIQAAPISYAKIETIYLTPCNFPSQGTTTTQTAEWGNRKIVFNLFNQVENKKQDKRSYINPEAGSLLTLMNDLDIIHLFSKINRTLTFCGETTLLNMLANPLLNKKDLLPRQQFIQKLVANEALFNLIQKIVQQFKTVEANILRLLDKKCAFAKDLKRF